VGSLSKVEHRVDGHDGERVNGDPVPLGLDGCRLVTLGGTNPVQFFAELRLEILKPILAGVRGCGCPRGVCGCQPGRVCVAPCMVDLVVMMTAVGKPLALQVLQADRVPLDCLVQQH
jgi:hypothetical protein